MERPPVQVDTPEGPGVIVPSKQFVDVYRKNGPRPPVWHLVEYPDGRRRYWNEHAVTVTSSE